MADILTELTKLAVSVFRARNNSNYTVPDWLDSILGPDAVLKESQRASFLSPESKKETAPILDLALRETELDNLAPREGELDPMLLYPGGGYRISSADLISSLLSSALVQMYFLRLTHNENTFVRTVLEGFEELRRAIRGERIRTHSITGIAKISLPEGTKISTPWGVIRPAPSVSSEQALYPIGQPKTSCILAEQRLIPVRFDRASSPENPFAAPDKALLDGRYLLPLACALASREASNPVVPLMIWSTQLLPFQSAFSYSLPHLTPSFGAEVDLGDQIDEIEEWARIVHNAHAPSVDIAARRLVSAIAHRLDRSDALIDAVMVWENLLGTSSEVTFRVSASLAKLLENDMVNRKELRKKLSNIYDVRSRLVHGVAIDNSEINKACTDAIDVAVKALRISYSKGRDWLSLNSGERSDTILLE